MHWRATLLVIATLFTASCGEEKDPKELVDAARTALAQKNWVKAAGSADEALALLTDSDPSSLRKEAQMYFVESSAHVTPELAKSRLEDMLANAAVSFDDFEYLTKKLVEAEAFSQATDVVDAAKELAIYSQSEIDPLGNWVANELRASAANSGNQEALDALKGFGYTGNDDAPARKVGNL